MTKSLNDWAQRSVWLAWALLLAIAIGAAALMLDRRPPFTITSYETNSPRAGGILMVNANVARELERRCSVTFSRYMVDSSGLRADLMPDFTMTAQALEELDHATPGRLLLDIHIPDYVSAGPAVLVTPLEYRCNPWHSLMPIETTMVIKFEVQS